ncbi:MAG TPA: CDP-alcohol phosphatidyltransferase family protein [Bacteroidota bacterium]|nr:CDP-alcohol phosphatidyltransferase family protein [Bacteroidota bacterium]
MWVETYRRSLKMPEAEEVFDLIFYRPVAFLLVNVLILLPITPNQVTMLSLIAGVVAAWYLSVAAGSALILAAVWYCAANILDCSDGQLARLQKSGTPLGRVIDGVADYVSSVAIFIGIGMGLSATGHTAWGLVIAAGVSSALHAILFDKYQGEFISTVRGEQNALGDEVNRTTNELQSVTAAGKTPGRAFILRLYLRYLKVQQRMSATTEQPYDPETYRLENLTMIRLWSFLGPTTNRTLLIVCALAGRVDIFLWTVVAAGNVWMIACSLAQKRIYSKLRPA